MINIEKTKRALQYIEALANGVDPLTGEPAREDDVINQIKVSRCLFYVTEVLREQLQTEGNTIGIAVQKRAENGRPIKKSEFYLSPEERDRIVLKEDLPISSFAAYVNSQIDIDKMKKLNHKKLIGWLVQAGYLTEQKSNAGATVRRPTEEGKKIGLYLQERVGQYGTHYIVTMYTPAAQRFLLDNLDAVLAK